MTKQLITDNALTVFGKCILGRGRWIGQHSPTLAVWVRTARTWLAHSSDPISHRDILLTGSFGNPLYASTVKCRPESADTTCASAKPHSIKTTGITFFTTGAPHKTHIHYLFSIVLVDIEKKRKILVIYVCTFKREG